MSNHPTLITISELLARPHSPPPIADEDRGRPRWCKTPGKSQAECFKELAAIEPRLNNLLAAAREYKRSSKGARRVCANDRWYGAGRWRGRSLKGQLETLVGWFAAKPPLRTEVAYEMAYEHIYHALPYCRNCLCMGVPQERHS